MVLGGLLAFAAVAFAVGHDALYRWAALRIIERAAGLAVDVEGSFDVRHALPLEVRAGSVVVGREGRPFVARVDALALRLRPGALLRGLVYLEALEIDGAEIDATVAPPGGGGGAFRLPVIERLQVSDVTVRVGLEEEALHEIRIDSLRLGNERDGLRRVAWRGSVDGANGTLDGTVGALETLLAERDPYPVGVELRIPEWALEATVRGSVERPLRGEGLRLDASTTIADVRPLMRLTGSELTDPLALEAHAVITGDSTSPALSDLRLDLESAERRVLHLKGTIADAAARTGIDLRFDVDGRETVLSALSGRLPLDLVSAKAKGRVRGDAPALAFSELDATVTTARGIEASAEGAIATAAGRAGETRLTWTRSSTSTGARTRRASLSPGRVRTSRSAPCSIRSPPSPLGSRGASRSTWTSPGAAGPSRRSGPPSTDATAR